ALTVVPMLAVDGVNDPGGSVMVKITVPSNVRACASVIRNGSTAPPRVAVSGIVKFLLQILSFGLESPFVPESFKLRLSVLGACPNSVDVSTITVLMLLGEPLPRDTLTVILPAPPAAT